MVAWKNIGKVYGSQAIAKGIERGGVEVDKYMGKAVAVPHERPSFFINILGGFGLGILADMSRSFSTNTKEVLTIMGGHMANEGWDYLEYYLTPAPAAAVGVRYGPTPAYETPAGAPEFYPPMYGQRAGREPVLKNHVRYTLEK